jgi:hypothetical protein
MAKERIVSPLNKALSGLVPMIYGAVFSYALFIIATIVLEFYEVIHANQGAISYADLSNYSMRVLLFIFIFAYMVEDVGAIIKLANYFPYLRSSRYTHEVIIAAFYVGTFTLLKANSYLAIVTFGSLIFWGGIWCNQFKEEYKDHKTSINLFMKTQRDLQYVGGSLFLVEAFVFIAFKDTFVFTWQNTICFVSSFCFWTFTANVLPIIRHGKGAFDYTLNILIPDFLIRIFTNNDSQIVRPED